MASGVEARGASDVESLTKSDTTVYQPFDAIWVGGAGNVAVRLLNGKTRTIVGAVAGSIVPVRFDMLMSTNTTATNCSGLRF